MKNGCTKSRMLKLIYSLKNDKGKEQSCSTLIAINKGCSIYRSTRRAYFYVMDYAYGITDIQEQYPFLPLEETKQTA